MGTKYSTVLVGGVVDDFHDGGPADDGSVTAANRVKFATIVSDLAAPLHSAITRMDGKLVDLVDEGPLTKSGAYTTTAADYAKTVECDGTFTLSLLDVSGAAGYKVTVKNAGSGTITVDVDGGANIDGAASDSLAAGECSTYRVNAGATAYYTEATFIGDAVLGTANGGTGGTLPVANGGTGATDAATARSNLGTIGTADVYAILYATGVL